MERKLQWLGVLPGGVIVAVSIAWWTATVVPAVAADKPAVSNAAWSPGAAARYLDGREAWWQNWDRARKDHGTLCVSCHTQATYALARPALRSRSGERAPSEQEQVMLASIEKRVREWKDMEPFYSDAISGAGKEVESRNAESVLNAFILTSYDAPRGHLSERTRIAFDNAWALQSKTGPDAGAWVWQNFDYAPWESKESQYHWAALMALAVGNAPDRYRDDPKIAANLALLRGYLQSHYDAQPLVNKIVANWAGKYLAGVVTLDRMNGLVEQVNRLQHADGGWSLTDLGTWKRRDNTPLERRSDGYATGLVVLALEESFVSSNKKEHIARGLAWLEANQDKTTGAWPAWSLNKNRDAKSDAGMFMSDAATSYAVLALEDPR
jgi:squalene-hopene/tetraprenyl-beta-curcumene cyclase